MRGEAAVALLPALILPLAPLLVPRAPVAASFGLAAGLTAASATELVGTVEVTFDLVLLLAMVVAGALAGPRRAVMSFVLLQAGAAAALGTDPAMPWPAVSYLSQALLLTGGWSVGALLRGVAVEQQRVAEDLDATTSELDALVRQAVQRERVRLAHELHDLVGHALTAVAIHAAAGLTQLRQRRPLERAPLRAAARQGVVELQRLAAVVRPAGDLAADLERIVAATGQTVALELPDRIELDDDLRHTVVSITAEALTNAAKHAAGAPVRVSLTHTRHEIALEVVDEGGRPANLPSGGNGIASMARRVRAMGGTFASGPRPGGGWAVSAVLPSAGDTIARRG
nr:histidine kinase [Solirubrobacter soli]